MEMRSEGTVCIHHVAALLVNPFNIVGFPQPPFFPPPSPKNTRLASAQAPPARPGTLLADAMPYSS